MASTLQDWGFSHSHTCFSKEKSCIKAKYIALVKEMVHVPTNQCILNFHTQKPHPSSLINSRKLTIFPNHYVHSINNTYQMQRINSPHDIPFIPRLRFLSVLSTILSPACRIILGIYWALNKYLLNSRMNLLSHRLL